MFRYLWGVNSWIGNLSLVSQLKLYVNPFNFSISHPQLIPPSLELHNKKNPEIVQQFFRGKLDNQGKNRALGVYYAPD